MNASVFEIMGASRRTNRRGLGLPPTRMYLGVGSRIGFESGSEFHKIGDLLNRYRIFSDLTAIRISVIRYVADYGDGSIPGVVVLESSVLGALVTDSLVGRVTATGEVPETLPAGTMIQASGIVGEGLPASGGWAYVISPSADSTYTKWYGMPVDPEPCPDGQWRTAEGECVPLVTVTPVAPAAPAPAGWTTGQKVALGVGIAVVFGGIVYAVSR